MISLVLFIVTISHQPLPRPHVATQPSSPQQKHILSSQPPHLGKFNFSLLFCSVSPVPGWPVAVARLYEWNGMPLTLRPPQTQSTGNERGTVATKLDQPSCAQALGPVRLLPSNVRGWVRGPGPAATGSPSLPYSLCLPSHGAWARLPHAELLCRPFLFEFICSAPGLR